MRCVRASLLLATWLLVGFVAAGARITQSGSMSEAGATASTVADQASSATQAETSSKAETKEYQLSPERYAKAIAYSRAGYSVYFASVLWGIVALILLLKIKAVAKLRDFAERHCKNFCLQAVLFVVPLSLLLAILELPIRV